MVGDTVYFGMDVNDVPTGKGGFYAVDASAGTLVWYFDVETGSVCRPDPQRRHPEVRRLPQRGAARSPCWLPDDAARAVVTTGPRQAAATCGRRPPTTQCGTSVLRHQQLRHRHQPGDPGAAAADASLRRGAGGPATPTARRPGRGGPGGGQRRSRLRRGAEPLHDERERHAHRGRRHRRQGRHVLRPRSRRRERGHRRGVERRGEAHADRPPPRTPGRPSAAVGDG